METVSTVNYANAVSCMLLLEIKISTKFAQMYSFYWFIFMQHLIIIIEQHI